MVNIKHKEKGDEEEKTDKEEEEKKKILMWIRECLSCVKQHRLLLFLFIALLRPTADGNSQFQHCTLIPRQKPPFSSYVL